MAKVTSEISMSLDGFITGPNVGVGNGMGDDGERLHDWRFDAKTETDAAIVDEIYESTGAVLIGKRMFDVGFEPWGDPPPFGMPVFVVTHKGGTTYCPELLMRFVMMVGSRAWLNEADQRRRWC